jgi:hypothetical protein
MAAAWRKREHGPVIGLKESLPENAIAVTVVGDARKFIVRRLPSLRALKLLHELSALVKPACMLVLAG